MSAFPRLHVNAITSKIPKPGSAPPNLESRAVEHSGSPALARSVSDAHQKAGNGDILVEIVPVQSLASSADDALGTLSWGGPEQSWEIGEGHTKLATVCQLHPQRVGIKPYSCCQGFSHSTSENHRHGTIVHAWERSVHSSPEPPALVLKPDRDNILTSDF